MPLHAKVSVQEVHNKLSLSVVVVVVVVVVVSYCLIDMTGLPAAFVFETSTIIIVSSC